MLSSCQLDVSFACIALYITKTAVLQASFAVGTERRKTSCRCLEVGSISFIAIMRLISEPQQMA